MLFILNYKRKKINLNILINYLSYKKDWEVNKIIPSITILSKWINNYITIQDIQIRLKLIEESFLETIELSKQSQFTLKKSQLLLNALSLTDDGIKFGMTLRSDVLILLNNKKHHEGLLAIDLFLSKWLFAVFCTSALKHQRVTFDTSSGLLLEKIAAEEAVHRIRALSEMKNRLTNGRRCFGLFHPCLPNEPLAFVHIALASNIITSMKDIYASVELENPSTVMYYSINSPHTALTGLNIATSLLKKTALGLQKLHPSINTHSTLSPIPGFIKWLKSIPKDFIFKISFPSQYLQELINGIKLYQNLHPNFLITLPENNNQNISLFLPSLIEVLSSTDWYIDDNITSLFKESICWLGYYYLIIAKGKPYLEGELEIIPPLDPVARFHLRNGAELLHINWLANVSIAGINSSAGLMVNYRYNLKNQEENMEQFLLTGGKFPISSSVPSSFNLLTDK